MSLDRLAILLDGARAMGCLVVALAFVRLGRAARDRLYHAFAAAFVLLASSEALIGLHLAPGDHSELAYVPRLVAFLLIIWAVIDKNRRAAPER